MQCPECQLEIPEDSIFCKGCGNKLSESIDTAVSQFCPEGERKHATVLFSDLSGYTAITEKLDPEEVKVLMGRIFAEAGKIVEKYEGTVERFFGDEIMALFGVPTSHEDDPVRAVRAALEINAAVASISPGYETQLGHALAMHTAINTGLLVTGDEYIGKGRHGLTGDSINLAKRLTGLAKDGEVLIGADTYTQVLGYFTVEAQPPTSVKGKFEPVNVYKVLSVKDTPEKLHRSQGLRADLIGRDKEMAALMEAVQQLRNGKGSIISVVGDAGTGKSRLIREFKARLDLKELRWHEGHAYGYTQSTPYYPLVNLLAHAFRIEESDHPDRMKEKIETTLKGILGPNNNAAPYIGGLYSLEYTEVTGVSPEFWQARLHDSIEQLLVALIEQGPTIVCFEDLHWADTSFLELLRKLLERFSKTAFFLCIYRPPFALYGRDSQEVAAQQSEEIYLEDLSIHDTEAMLRSLLGNSKVPPGLTEFVRSRAEGNPFYLEEVINALIESGILQREHGDWNLAQSITETDIPPTIHGVLASRIDRLDQTTKRLLQEASVIGRAFLYEILKRITDTKTPIDQYLSGLEQLDLIRARSIEPDLEYIFKHVLTQEVVYSGLLKKERQNIHERIGLSIEQLFPGRLPEFYEALAYHFSKGKSLLKAVNYLSRSGEKSFNRFALDEAHSYYTDAFALLKGLQVKTSLENESIIALIIRWALVYYYKGDFIGLEKLIDSYEDTANQIDDTENAAMFYAWQGFAAWWTDGFDKSNTCLIKALELSESSKSLRAKGYALTWLSWLYVETGSFEKGVETGMAGNKIAKVLNDPYLYFKSLGAVSRSHFYTGNAKECLRIGKHLVDYGTQANHIRCIVMGHYNSGEGYFAAGDFASAKKSYTKAHAIAKDPFFVAGSLCFSILPDIASGNMTKASEYIDQLSGYFTKYGNQHVSYPLKMLEGIVLIDAGHFSKGWEVMSKCRKYFKESGRKNWHYNIEHIMGKIFLTIVQGEKSVGLLSMVKNANFIISKAIFAYRLAEAHFKTAIEIADRAGATGFIGQVYLDLAILYKIKNRHELTVEYLEKAVPIFKEFGAYEHLKQANKILTSLV